MKKLATLMALAAVAGLMLTAAPQDAQARPQYVKAAAKKYEKAAEALGEKKCNACHGMEDGKSNKKLRSDYSKALEEALGKNEDGEPNKNVKDAAEIDAALEKAGKKKNKAGKAYGDLLKAGKLPAPHESIKE